MVASRSLQCVVGQLRQWRSAKLADAAGDGHLLRDLAEQGDSSALVTLIDRHGAMVLGVCRRVLRHEQDAEDAFQATFLTLMQKAASLVGHPSLGGWLHTVACRIALRARASAQRRATLASPVPACKSGDPLDQLTARELCSALDEELRRLPERYRGPVVLCCLEGRTRDEAAQGLGWTVGAVKGRLERGRELLRRRLARRGISLPAALGTLSLGHGSQLVGPALLRSTTVAAASMVSGATAEIPVGVLALLGGSAVPRGTGWLAGLAVVLVALVGGMALTPAQPTKTPPKQGKPEGAAGAAAAGGQDPLPPGATMRLGEVGLRHGEAICSSALSPDGKFLATASGRSVAVWDLVKRRRVRTFQCNTAPRYSYPPLAFSPDGKSLGYVHRNSLAILWNLSTGKEIRRFEVKEGQYGFCQFTPDGKQLALSSKDRIDLWDLDGGEIPRSARVGEYLACCSPDGKLVVRLDGDALFLHELRTGKEKLRVPADGCSPRCVSFSPDGTMLTLVNRGKNVEVRRADGGLVAAVALPVRDQRGECVVAFSADGRTLLVGTKEGQVHRWRLSTKKELPPLKGHLGNVSGVFTPDSRTIVTTAQDGMIRFWNADTARETGQPKGHVGQTCLAHSPRAFLAAVADSGGRLELYDTKTGKLSRTVQASGSAIRGLAFTDDGKTLASAGTDGKIRLWNVDSGKQTVTINADGQDLRYMGSMAFSPDGALLSIRSGSSRLQLYDVATGKAVWHAESPCGAFSPDGKFLAASDGNICIAGQRRLSDLAILEAGSGRPTLKVPLKGTLPSKLSGIHHVAYSPDGRWIAAAPPGKHVCLCDSQTGEKVRQMEAIFPTEKVEGLPKELLMALGGYQAEAIHSIAFTHDSKLMATCGLDGAVRLWEVATGGKVLERTGGHEGKATQVRFTPDGRSVLSCGADGQVLLWSLRPVAAAPKGAAQMLLEDLRQDNPERAYRAVWALSEAPSAPAFLREKIPPAALLAEAALARHIGNLSKDTFAEREAASRALGQLGSRAAPALRKALAAGPDAETRRRIGRILAALKNGPTEEERLHLRAVQALELAGTAGAQRTLRDWAGGAADAPLTLDAAAALKRLRARPKARP